MTDEVCAGIAQNVTEAELMISMLRMEGIRAFWRRTNWAAGAADGSGFGGPAEILVAPRDAKRARELLASG